MRRVVGILASVAFATMLCCAVARATSALLDTAAPDIGAQLMLRLFGETSDATAAFAAAAGDRTSESPLRDLALQIPSPDTNPAYVTGITTASPARDFSRTAAPTNVSDLEHAFDAGLLHGDAGLAPPAPDGDAVTLAPSALLTATYQPVAAPKISPAPGTLAFDTPAKAVQTPAFAPVSAHVGGVQFEGNVAGGSSENSALSLHDSTGGAGANFQVRAGKRDINLNLDTQYERLERNDSSALSSGLSSASAWQLPGSDAPLAVPNYADLNRLSVGAGLAVPVLRGLTLNLNYGVQHLYGGYGLPGLVNLDTVNNFVRRKTDLRFPRRIEVALDFGVPGPLHRQRPPAQRVYANPRGCELHR